MLGAQVEIAEKAFHNHGFDVDFDERRYLGLMAAEVTKQPAVHLLPHKFLGASGIRRFIPAVSIGKYSQQTGRLNVSCLTPESANYLLRHETKHWADDVAGTLEASGIASIRKRRMVCYGGLAAIEAATITVGVLDEPATQAGVALIGATATIVGGFIVYMTAPHEQAARQFASDEAIAAQWDSIISLTPR